MAAGTAVLLAAAGLAAGSAAYPALAAGPGPASTTQPAAATWKVVKKVAGEDFTAVVATGRNGGWAFPGSSTRFGAWHFDGRGWTHVASGHGLQGGSGLSAHDVWSFDGTDVAHWNGSAWSRTSVARLLPAAQKTHLNDPAVAGIFAVSADSVYAVGNGNQEDDGGPMVLLHWNGRAWSKVAGGLFGFDVEPAQPMASDGHGGLWIPMAGPEGGSDSHLLHYSGGRLTTAAVPGGPSRTDIATVARIPGTSEVLAGGFMHAANNTGVDDAGVLLEFEA